MTTWSNAGKTSCNPSALWTPATGSYDMFGGTPSNLAISVMDRPKIEVIAGINLPMLIKLASLRSTETLADAVRGAQEAGRKYINVASQLLADARG